MIAAYHPMTGRILVDEHTTNLGYWTTVILTPGMLTIDTPLLESMIDIRMKDVIQIERDTRMKDFIRKKMVTVAERGDYSYRTLIYSCNVEGLVLFT